MNALLQKSCINCGADLTGQRHYANRDGDPRCQTCHRARCRAKREEARRQALRHQARVVARSLVLLVVAAPLIYGTLEVLTWASSGRLTAPAAPVPASVSPVCTDCPTEAAQRPVQSLTAFAP